MSLDSLIQHLQLTGWTHLQHQTLGSQSWRLCGIYAQKARVLTVIQRADSTWRILESGKFWRWSPQTNLSDDAAIRASDSQAPMDGIVREVLVAADQIIEPQQPLYVLEAMKMQMQVCASRSGRVRSVLLTAGQPVRQGQQVLRIEN